MLLFKLWMCTLKMKNKYIKQMRIVIKRERKEYNMAITYKHAKDVCTESLYHYFISCATYCGIPLIIGPKGSNCSN